VARKDLGDAAALARRIDVQDLQAAEPASFLQEPLGGAYANEGLIPIEQ